MLLENLILFKKIIETGSLSAAAKELNMSKASASERLNSLERYYNCTLIKRTTRALSITEEGKIVLEKANNIINEDEQIKNLVSFKGDTISGSIKLIAPFDIGENRILPVIKSFINKHPKVNIELFLDDGHEELVSLGVDLAIRYGKLPDSTLKIRQTFHNSRILCASPDYINKHGKINHPDEIAQHNSIIMRRGKELDNLWVFKKAENTYKIVAKGNMIINSGNVVKKLAINGAGIALKSIWDIENELKSGVLIPMLEDYEANISALQIVYPNAEYQAKRVRLLMDDIVLALKQSDLIN